MFAVVEIIHDKLYATQTGDGNDIFNECFENWQDPLYISESLKDQPSILPFFKVGKKEARKLILKESSKFYAKILSIARGEKPSTSLDDFIFKPLHDNDDFDMPLISAKAYGTNSGKSFLRIYALRLSDGCYLVIGGMIKLHTSMQESKEGRDILKDLKKWANYFRENRIDDAFDLVELIIE